MLHCNTELPCHVGNDERSDSRRIMEIFDRGRAQLLVHGHQHDPEVVTVLANGKVVVNSDCRVVLLLPDCLPEPQAPLSDVSLVLEGSLNERRLPQSPFLTQKTDDRGDSALQCGEAARQSHNDAIACPLEISRARRWCRSRSVEESAVSGTDSSMHGPLKSHVLEECGRTELKNPVEDIDALRDAATSACGADIGKHTVQSQLVLNSAENSNSKARRPKARWVRSR